MGRTTEKDKNIIGQLNAMGMDEESFRVVALLPLIQVAWADEAVQPKERELILKIAGENRMLEGDEARRVLEGWLSNPPTEEYLEKGRRLLVELAHRQRGVGAELPAETLDAVLNFCEDVAAAAGGLFGLAWKVDARERSAIKEIADALEVESSRVVGEIARGEAESNTWEGLEDL